MLSLEQFASLAEIYGADIRRWPLEVQTDASALLDISAGARAVLADELALDIAIAPPRHKGKDLWSPGELNSAVARLRLGVAARIEPSSRARFGFARLYGNFFPSDGVLRPSLGWLSFATSSTFATVIGLFIGSHLLTLPPHADLLAVFPVPQLQFFPG